MLAWEGCVLEFGDVSIVRADSNLVGDGELYFLTPVSIPKMHHIIRLALAIIMNISNRRISIYVKHARFMGCHAVTDERARVCRVGYRIDIRTRWPRTLARLHITAGSEKEIGREREKDESERYHLNFNESCGCKCRSYSFSPHSCVYTHRRYRARTRTHVHVRTRDRVTTRTRALLLSCTSV